MALPEFRWARTDLNEKARRSALAVLSPVEAQRYATTSDAAKNDYLAGRMVLRGLAGALTGTHPGAVELVAICPDCGGPHGRPAIPGSSLNLSLSHGAGVVVAAASWHSAVGIDVETPEPSRQQLAAIEAVAGEASVEHWTRVEAVLKADGRGLRVDPARVSIATVGGRLTGWVDDSPARYELSEVELANDVRVSVAVAR